ncbi:uncharacterized protein N7482_009987 [Penicillium canariense]|uniref:Uncharacterized protein n=1 Tax=Penicillium canariense TaxID=189055 RepID=A0A9W9HU62_9EURO|nr:uncharacterized protein N7482_009987 [Penicillium canariense]KAJ5153509.1 hypothetical protein N7482_009987 [Penicillium canariense]
MKFTAIVLALAGTAWGAAPQRRDDTAATTAIATATDAGGFNIEQISSALAHLSMDTTASANFANISPPPKKLIPELLSVVPVTVLLELVDAQSRSSLASEFRAGNTPAWYNSLPADVKSYISVVKSQILGGALTATTGLAYETSSASSAGGTGATATAASSTATGATSSSTSKGLAASQPAGLTASVIGALSVLGLALAL